MLCFMDDGVYCKKCGKYHPTLWWHKKYGYSDTYKGMKEAFEDLVENRPGMVFGHTHPTEEEKKKALEQILKLNYEIKKYKEGALGKCVVCGAETLFMSKETERHVCSDECLYKENGWGEDCTGRSFNGVDPEQLEEYKKLCRARGWPDK